LEQNSAYLDFYKPPEEVKYKWGIKPHRQTALLWCKHMFCILLKQDERKRHKRPLLLILRLIMKFHPTIHNTF